MSLTCVFQTERDSDEAFVSTLYRQLMKFKSRSSKRGCDGHTIEVQLLGADGVTVLGGLLGATSYGYLHIDAVCVPYSLRGSGIGRELILIAEEEARKRSCTGAWLDAFSFQARGFYEKLGYVLLGELPDSPLGHSRYFSRKTLSAPKLL